MRFVHALLAAAAVAAPLSQAQAGLFVQRQDQSSTFNSCDGYNVPNGKSDGITTSAWMFGLMSATADLRRGSTKLGDVGITACDQALADPRLLPAYELRRSHLLQARAVHLIHGGKLDDALKSLDLSDQAGRNQPLFDQSVGQGNRALRAIALNGLGKKADAEAILNEMEKRRPYAISERQLAMHVRLQFEDDLASQMRILEAQAPLLPTAQHQLFWLAMQYDDFKNAVRYASGVSYDDPRKRGNWKGEGEEIEKYLDILERAKFAGALAYAQSATAQPAAAARTLADARTLVDSSMLPPPPPPVGHDWRKTEKLDWERRKLVGSKSIELLRIWQTNIDLRSAAREKKVGDLPALISASHVKIPVLTDVIMQSQTPEPMDTVERTAALQLLNDAKDKERLKSMRMGFPELVKMLPRPEVMTMQPRWQTEGAGIMRSDLNGYAVRKNDNADSFTVRFGAATGTLAMVDEGALLAAAYHARKQGRDAFLIDTRKPIQRTIQYTGLYSGGRTENSGYEVQLVIRPVDFASADTNTRARLVRADDVIRALSPKFQAPAQ